MKGTKKRGLRGRRLLGTAALLSVLAVLLSGDPPASAVPRDGASAEAPTAQEPVRARVLEPAPPAEPEEPPASEEPAKPATVLVPESEPVEDDYFADAVFLGDTAHDAEVARAIGCRCYLIAGGHQEEAVLAKAQVPVLRSLRELYPILGV